MSDRQNYWKKHVSLHAFLIELGLKQVEGYSSLEDFPLLLLRFTHLWGVWGHSKSIFAQNFQFLKPSSLVCSRSFYFSSMFYKCKTCFWDTWLSSMTYFRNLLHMVMWHLHIMSFFIFCFLTFLHSKRFKFVCCSGDISSSNYP